MTLVNLKGNVIKVIFLAIHVTVSKERYEAIFFGGGGLFTRIKVAENGNTQVESVYSSYIPTLVT